MYPDFSGVATLGTAVLIFTIIFSVLAWMVGVTLYILLSIGLMKIAQNRGIPNPWLAWIPLANMYLMGKILDGNMDIFSMNVNRLEWSLPVTIAVLWLLSKIPFIGFLFWLALIFFEVFVWIKFYKMYDAKNYILFTILSAIGLFPIFVFVVRNKPAVHVPAAGKPIFQ